MRKKWYRAGGQNPEQKQPKKPKSDRENKNYVSIRRSEPGADRLMESLDVPLTPEQSSRIVELADYGWLRSDIAKEVGVPKTRVNHELIVKRRGGGAA
ncbi:hypothetical protein [Paenibacillus sp. UASWS1643]|uniref:hypothetical protein n=1 Tax=Paenibacillus sp. UASWS1643 TaxID=2580422 RepID=UPI00123B47D1|nr:hypothetical protein [Paenibacillus sp. UASWS1643]KAA8747123.1 hypothetical protein FE296_23335 [Paenibacillus sp. UASWS1643]